MRRDRKIILAALSVCCSAVLYVPSALSQATAAGAGDIAKGRDLAERLCSSCHTVTPGTSSGSMPARGFEELANAPGQTQLRLAGSIIIPHPAIPNVPLNRTEIRDIVAYISSLGRTPPEKK